jgi:hypothetical protein
MFNNDANMEEIFGKKNWNSKILSIPDFLNTILIPWCDHSREWRAKKL